MADEADNIAPASELSRFNQTLVVLVQLATMGTILGTSYNVMQFREVLTRFRQVKVGIPVIPLLLTEYHAVFLVVAAAVAVKCVWETFHRRSARRTVSLNLAGLLLLLVWWMLHSTVFYLTIAAVINLSVPRDP